MVTSPLKESVSCEQKWKRKSKPQQRAADISSGLNAKGVIELAEAAQFFPLLWWQEISPHALSMLSTGANTTIFCSHRDLLRGPSRKKTLIPKVPGNWCAVPPQSTYQGVLRLSSSG